MKAQYIFTINGTEVNPDGKKKLTIALDNRIYKRSLSAIKLSGPDYDFVKSLPECSMKTLEIRRRSNNGLVFSGKCQITKDFEAKRQIELKVTEATNIAIIENNQATEVPLGNAGQRQIFIGFGAIPPGTNGTWTTFSGVSFGVMDNLGAVIDSVTSDVQMIVTSPVSVPGWDAWPSGNTWSTPYAGAVPIFQGYVVLDPKDKFLTALQPYFGGSFTVEYPVGSGTMVPVYLFYETDTIEYNLTNFVGFEYLSTMYYRGVLLREFVNKLLATVPTDSPLTCKSAFLFGDAVESGNTWTRDVVDWYPNTLQLHSTTNIKDKATLPIGNNTRAALSAFVELLKWLNAYWFIDVDGFFRVEHISYKRYYSVTDLRTYTVNRGKQTIYACEILQELEFAEELAGKIDFTPTAYAGQLYAQRSIVYQGYCVDKAKTESRNPGGFIFDYNAAHYASEKIPDEGILLVDVAPGNSPTDIFATPNICEKLYRHESNYQTFKVDSATYTAETLAYAVKVADVQYSEIQHNFSGQSTFKTHYASGAKQGIAENTEIDLESGILKISLKFEK